MWMTLLYIVAIAVVAVIVAVALFYIAIFLTAALGFVSIVKGVGTSAAKKAEETDLDRSIRIQKKKDKEEDRKASRDRKQRFWNRLFGNRTPETVTDQPKKIVQVVDQPKRIPLKKKRQPTTDEKS